jgi:thiol-disulfide isomerase/thioredoxin
MKMMRVFLLLVLLLVSSLAAASEFEFKDMQGRTQRLADFKGKWLLVNFWATWCPPCLEEIPGLVDLYNERKDKDFVIIGVAMSSPRDSIVAFAKQMEISYPIVIGSDKMAAQIGKVDVLPTSFLYDPQGKLVSYQPGAVTRKDIENFIRSRSGH